MHWNYGYGWGCGVGFGCLAVLFFCLLVALGFVYLIKLLIGWKREEGNKQPGGQKETPLEIIKTRYARGEITREEFEKMREDLMKE